MVRLHLMDFPGRGVSPSPGLTNCVVRVKCTHKDGPRLSFGCGGERVTRDLLILFLPDPQSSHTPVEVRSIRLKSAAGLSDVSS